MTTTTLDPPTQTVTERFLELAREAARHPQGEEPALVMGEMIVLADGKEIREKLLGRDVRDFVILIRDFWKQIERLKSSQNTSAQDGLKQEIIELEEQRAVIDDAIAEKHRELERLPDVHANQWQAANMIDTLPGNFRFVMAAIMPELRVVRELVNDSTRPFIQ